MLTIEQCRKYIIVMLIATVADGIVSGYCFHNKEYDLMFVPLFVGFILLFITYYFIEMKGNLESGFAVSEY
ncbi:hypothetical protein TALC_00950 [Thermoplasmatales archaeon BRNA1]|nr:hypothetical protein TALC_00950 [Thermoplasmatales archaeon BRNA1]